MDETNQSSSAKGRLFLLGAAVLFSGMTLMVKVAARLGVPAYEAIFFRFSLGFLLFLATRKAGLTPFRAVNRNALVWRGIWGGLAMMAYFQAIAEGGVSIAAILNNTYPIFVAALSFLTLGERVKAKAAVLLPIAFCGVYLVINPDWNSIELPSVYGLASGVLAALAILTLRKCRKTDSTWAILYYLHFVGLIMTSVFLFLPGFIVPNGVQFAAILSVVGLSVAAQTMLTYGYRFVPAAEGSIITLFVPVFATLGSVAIFGERLGWNVIAGGAAVVAAGAALQIGERRKPLHKSDDACD